MDITYLIAILVFIFGIVMAFLISRDLRKKADKR